MREFEERASGFKSALTHSDSSDGETKATSRGEWMLKPPEYDIGGARAHGTATEGHARVDGSLNALRTQRRICERAAADPLRSRGFSQKDAKKHDSSAWTETPADRARKAEEARVRLPMRMRTLQFRPRAHIFALCHSAILRMSETIRGGRSGGG